MGEAMKTMRMSAAAVLAAACVAVMSGQGKPAAPAPVDLDGAWRLNRELSQFPRDLGFGMDVVGGGKTTMTDAGRGGGQSVSPGLVANRPASREEAENSRQLVNEVRNPPERLTISSDAGTIVVTNEGGRARTYYPDGREAFTTLDAAPVATVTRWEGSRLVIRYKVEPGREVRYTVSRKASPPQLVIQADLVERGGRDSVVRVYEPPAADAPAAQQAPERPAPQQAPPVVPLPSQRPGAAPPAPAPADAAKPLMPAVPSSAAPANLDQTPGAELKGLSALGIVVEDLGAEAASCGLRQEAIEAAAAKSLSGAGLKVLRSTVEDTYVYIRVVTAATTAGTCFSRYDAFVYSYTAATMSYGSRPALVQVSLLNRGGMTASGAKGHAESVTRAIVQYVDQFAAQIRDANK